ESLNRNYMSLYDYESETTPHLKALADSAAGGKLFVFDDVISPEVLTIECLRTVLTNLASTDHKLFEKSVTLVDLFKQAGYRTYWLSNQSLMRRFYESAIGVTVALNDSVFYTLSNHVRNASDKTIIPSNYYDEELFRAWDGIVSEKVAEKEVYFVHLRGQHFNYSDRYPAQFKMFNRPGRDEENHYLDSVLYNDWVISRFLERAPQAGVDLVCYFSDHGEDLTHQHNPQKYTPAMVSIPFMVFLSDNYIEKKPNLSAALTANKVTPAMTDNFFHVRQTLTGIESSLYNPGHSFINEQYEPSEREAIHYSTNYDK